MSAVGGLEFVLDTWFPGAYHIQCLHESVAAQRASKGSRVRTRQFGKVTWQWHIQHNMPKNRYPRWRSLARAIARFDETLGVAVIDRNYVVQRANPVHLDRWPELKGKVCFRYVNRFRIP